MDVNDGQVTLSGLGTAYFDSTLTSKKDEGFIELRGKETLRVDGDSNTEDNCIEYTIDGKDGKDCEE